MMDTSIEEEGPRAAKAEGVCLVYVSSENAINAVLILLERGEKALRIQPRLL